MIKENWKRNYKHKLIRHASTTPLGAIATKKSKKSKRFGGEKVCICYQLCLCTQLQKSVNQPLSYSNNNHFSTLIPMLREGGDVFTSQYILEIYVGRHSHFGLTHKYNIYAFLLYCNGILLRSLYLLLRINQRSCNPKCVSVELKDKPLDGYNLSFEQ